MDKNEALIILVDEFLGNTAAFGETYTDKRALKQLDLVDVLLFDLIGKLCENSINTGHESSVIDVREKSVKILRSVYNFIGDYLGME